MKITREKITILEVIVKVLTIISVFFIAYYAKDSDKHILNVLGLLVTFFCSIYLHRHFVPFITLAIACFLTANIQELWSISYIESPVTKNLWTAGYVFLPIGFIDFLLKLIFKYKIIDNED